MQVKLDRTSGVLALKGDMAVFTPEGSAAASIQFAIEDIEQLLRSRKAETTAKITLTTAANVPPVSHVIQFDSLVAREGFIEVVITSQQHLAKKEAPAVPPEDMVDNWVASSICHAAVDVGVMDEEELQRLLRGEYQRGVQQAFDALGLMVDRATLQLLPITEQVESDVLRQIPILAVIFERHVMDEDTKKTFWEAVVRKYFCFSRTFLEDDLRALEEEHGAAPLATISTGGLASINSASVRALPKATRITTAGIQAEDEDDMLTLEVAANSEARDSKFAHFFLPRGRVQASMQGDLLTLPLSHHHRPLPVTPSRTVRARCVMRALPKEPTAREGLETLRKFWRCSSGPQREEVLAKYIGTSKGKSESFLLSTCFAQAHRSLHRKDR